MLYSNQEEAVAESYFTFANDIAGILAVTLAATALQFEHPEPFAWFFLFIIVLWAFSKGADYRRIAKRYVARFKGVFGYIALFWKIKIFFIGTMCLTYVGAGVITKNVIYKLSGF